MFYLRSSFLLFALLLLGVGNHAQKFEDKTYYLVDSLDLENTEEFELVILDSCIKAHHQSKSDLDKLDAILYLVKESYDQNIWPKYNQWLKVFVEKKLKEPNLTETEKSKYTSTLASIYNNEGYFYDDRGNFSAALQSYHKGLKISEKINDQVGMSQAFMNIGAVYHVMDNMDQALSYYEKSLTIDKELHDTIGIARTLGNIGIIYS